MKIGIVLAMFVISVLLPVPIQNPSGANAAADDRTLPQDERSLEWQGLYGGFEEARLMVIRDQNTWQDVYKAITGSDVVPELNFGDSMVIAVFMGQRMTGGYRVSILNADQMDGVEVTEERLEGDRDQVKFSTRIEGKILVVQYEEISPGPDQIVTMAITTPYHIRVVRRSDLPVVFIRYARTTG